MNHLNKFKEDLQVNLLLLSMLGLIYLIYSSLTLWSESMSPPKTDIVQVKGVYLEFEFNYDICVGNHRPCHGLQKMFIGIGDDNQCYALNYPGSLLSQRMCHERYQQIIENQCVKTEFDSQKYCFNLLKAINSTGTMKSEASAEFNPVEQKIQNIIAIKSN